MNRYTNWTMGVTPTTFTQNVMPQQLLSQFEPYFVYERSIASIEKGYNHSYFLYDPILSHIIFFSSPIYKLNISEYVGIKVSANQTRIV